LKGEKMPSQLIYVNATEVNLPKEIALSIRVVLDSSLDSKLRARFETFARELDRLEPKSKNTLDLPGIVATALSK
jgi:hypothetical protein